MTKNYYLNKTNTKRYLEISCLTLLIFSLFACSDNNTPSKTVDITQNPTLLSSIRLQQPSSCADLKSYVVNSIIKQHTRIPKNVYCPGTTDAGGPVAAAPTKNSTPDDVSETNNQETGVFESDIVKADDRGNIYIASGSHLVITDGFPPENMKTLKEINLDGHVTDLFLDKLNNRLIVISRFETPYTLDPNIKPVSKPAFAPAPLEGYTDILFLDVTIPATPITLKQTRLKGFFQTGRRIDNRLHLILREYQNYYTLLDTKFSDLKNNYSNAVRKFVCATGEKDPDVIANNPEIAVLKLKLTENITSTFDTVNMEDHLPTAFQGDGKTDLVQVPFLACNDIQHPKINSNLNLQFITSLDTDGNNMSATAMINNSRQTYVSKNNIYVSETSRNWWWNPLTKSIPTSQTAIYKFAISKQKPVYTATGSIDGYIKNQFSFSEFNGDLRVATTQDDWVSETDKNGVTIRRRNLSNNLFVLRDDGNQTLETIGSVKGFGKNETIRSSRFMGNRAFVVTFRNVDPLFTFDLSIPETPNLMGELTIPGFSSYMHPYDDTHLVTIGRAPGAGGVGVGSGIQLQLFNVSDLTKPRLVDNFIPVMPKGWSWSAAEYDHKAFMFYSYKEIDTPKNLLAIPIQYYGSRTSTGFSGIYAFNVDTTGFTELGRVDHADLAKQYYCDPKYINRPYYQFECVDGAYVRWAAPTRSVIMTKNKSVYLYTFSDVGMKASEIKSLNNALGQILFPEQVYPRWYILGGGIVL